MNEEPKLEDWHYFMAELANKQLMVGISFYNAGNYLAAREATQKAVNVYSALYASHPDFFADKLAMSLNNLGLVLRDLGDRQSAKEVAQEAVNHYRSLHTHQPDDFAGKLAMSLNNLGLVLRDLGDRQSAKEVAQEAVNHYRSLHTHNPDVFTAKLAMSLDNLGLSLRDLGDRQSAKEVAQEAVNHYRSLHTHNSDVFTAKLADSLNNLGVMLRDLGSHQVAKDVFQEAVNHYRSLHTHNPDVFTAKLAMSLDNLGLSLRDLGDCQSAKEVAQEAVNHYRSLHTHQPDAFASYLASSLNNLGLVLSDLGDRQSAKEVAQEAVNHYRSLHTHQPDAFAGKLAMSLNNLGLVLRDLGDRQSAKEVAQEAVNHYRSLHTHNPDVFTAKLAMSLNNLGIMLSDLGDRQSAKEVVQEAVNHYRSLHTHQPDALASSLSNLGIILSDLGDRQAAKDATQEAVDLCRVLHTHNSDVFTAKLASSLNNLGARLSNLKDRQAAKDATQEAVDYYRVLYAYQPDAFTDQLASSLNNLGIMLSDLGSRQAALKSYREAAKLLITTKNIIQWSPFDWLTQIKRCATKLSSPNDLTTVHLKALALFPEMRLSPLYNREIGQEVVSVQAYLVADLWRKLKPAAKQDASIINEMLPAVVAALQSPDLQRWLIDKGRGTPEATAVAEAEAAVRRANNEVHLLWQRIRGGGSDNMDGGGGGMSLRHSMEISPLVNATLQEQFKIAKQQAQIARQVRQDSRNALAEVDPAFAAAYRALSADDLIALLTELKRSAAPHRASADAPAALLCLLDIPANGDIPAAIVGMLITSDGIANRIQAVDFPDLHTLAQSCSSYTPIGQRSCEVLRRLESDTIPAESINLSFDELITQLETTWWNPLQQALGENANTLGMLHICTHGVTHHLPFAAVSALRSDGNLALFQWPGLPYLRLAHTLKQTRSATMPFITSWPDGLWQIGHDCAWTDRVPLPMAAVEASLLHRLMRASLGNGSIPSVETVTEPEQLNAQSAGLVLCAHGSGAQADDTHVRMANGHLSTREVLERGLAPHLVLLPVCHAGQSADDAHGNALGLAAGFLLAGAGVVVGSSKPVPDTYMLWFTSLLLWYVRQGLSAYEAATRARTDFGAGNFPEDYRAWVKSEVAEAMAVLHLGGAEYQGVEQMQAQYQQSCKAAQIAGQPLPHYPLEGMIKDWPWVGFREAALPLATTDEGMRQNALSLVAARAFEDKPNSQTSAIMREMAAFIVVCGLG